MGGTAEPGVRKQKTEPVPLGEENDALGDTTLCGFAGQMLPGSPTVSALDVGGAGGLNVFGRGGGGGGLSTLAFFDVHPQKTRLATRRDVTSVWPII